MSAVALLGHTNFGHAGSVIGELLDARHPPEIQLQAIRALERFGDPRGGELLVQPENWTSYSPPIKEAVLSAMLSRPPMIGVMFAAIQRGGIRAAEISPLQRTRLLKHADPAIRQGAEAIFGEFETGDRMKIYHAYRDVLQLAGNPGNGAVVFTRACSACHAYNAVGGKVGPDLTGIRNQPADALLLHILVPDYEVVPSYQAVVVSTKDGRQITGWLVAEADNGLTLRTASGADEVVLRTHLDSLVATGRSLMPDGLEQTMTKADLANLIAYLKDEPTPSR